MRLELCGTDEQPISECVINNECHCGHRSQMIILFSLLLGYSFWSCYWAFVLSATAPWHSTSWFNFFTTWRSCCISESSNVRALFFWLPVPFVLWHSCKWLSLALVLAGQEGRVQIASLNWVTLHIYSLFPADLIALSLSLAPSLTPPHYQKKKWSCLLFFPFLTLTNLPLADETS